MLFVGVILFAVKVKIRTEYLAVTHVDFLGYSFGLTVCAGILMLIGAIVGGVTGLSAAEQKFNM